MLLPPAVPFSFALILFSFSLLSLTFFDFLTLINNNKINIFFGKKNGPLDNGSEKATCSMPR
jgi:hypothetical protein